MSSFKPRVVMVGPSRKEQGGITAVVNGFFDHGLAEGCSLTYLPVTCKGSKSAKLAAGIKALHWFRGCVGTYDIVHVHMGGGNSYYRERLFVNIGVSAGVPVILHIHDGLFETLWEERAGDALRLQIRETFKSCARVVVLSTAAKDYMLANVAPNLHITLMTNGVSVPKRVVLPKERGTVLFLGHFDNNKNAGVLVRAMVKVRERFPEARAYFGADGDVENFERLVAEFGVQDCCTHLGWIGLEKKQEMLDRCSIFCLPSINEAMPIALLEAMANGLAAVVTPVGGMLDLVEKGVSGIFVPVDDEMALADALIGLMEDEGKRVSLAEAARARTKEYFTFESLVARQLSLYREVVEQNGSEG